MTKEQLWEAVLGELELSLSKANFTTWFKNTFIASLSDEQVIIAVPNTFTKTWFENKYHAQILKIIQKLTAQQATKVEYKIETARVIPAPVTPTSGEPVVNPTTPASGLAIDPQPTNQPANEIGLNPRYTFENYVVGKGNELAKAAAQAVTNKLGVVYNPLFIYGGVGLGKTHLMQAIGNELLLRGERKKIAYVTCERFTSEFIQAVSKGGIADFKERYRGVDVLLIDDIQFLAGKEGTQEEFFHTFNTLHQANKQIVISSDRPPKAIPALENRLVSRFEWGMIVDISQPDFETRMAILNQKCIDRTFTLEPEVMHFIANSVQNNIRELEGALNRIIAYHELNQSTPTLESTKSILSSLTQQPKKGAVVPKQVLSSVANFYDVKIEDITGASRKKELVTPRQIIMYLLREEVGCSYPLIGHELGGRDHTTAMHAHSKIAQELQTNEKLQEDITLIKQRLYNSAT